MGLEIFRLNGRVALITGATKGLGLAMANALASAGADIVVNSRNQAEADVVAESIRSKHGTRAIAIAADVTQPDQVQGMVDRIIQELGSIDVLINNAGINIREPTLNLSLEDWRTVVDVNLTAPFVCTKFVVPHMVRQGRGRIIYMSSMLGHVGLTGRPAYTATKGALVLLTKTQALEFATQGITVNAICPGPFETPMNKPLLDDPEKYKAFVSKIPMGRWGYIHELDGLVIFLASDASSYMTGTTLVIDGGWTAQ